MKIRVDVAALCKDPKLHIQKKCGGTKKNCPACLALAELRLTRQHVAMGYNVAMRLHWRVDADTLDRFLVEQERPPKTNAEWSPRSDVLSALRSVLPARGSGEISTLADKVVKLIAPKQGEPYHCLYTYPAVRAACPTLSSNVAAYIYRQAERKWLKTRWDALIKQEKSPPHYKRTVPIPVPAANVKLIRDGGPGNYSVRFSLHSKTHNAAPEQFFFRIQARDKRMRTMLDALTHPVPEDRWKLGALQIQEDRVRPGRWYFTFAYTRRIPKVPRTDRVGAINRGMVAFLVSVTNTGDQFIYDGTDIIAQLKHYQRRRKEYQRQLRASMRGGHGRKRALKPIDKLRGEFENWRTTHNQKLARAFVRWLIERNSTVLYLEDFQGIRDSPPEKLEGGEWIWKMIQEWPYHDLGMRIISCAEEAGLQVIVLPPKDISRRCPECGHTDKSNMDLKNRMFRCQADGCGFKRHLDVAASMNLLARADDCEKSGSARGAREKKTKKKRAPKTS